MNETLISILSIVSFICSVVCLWLLSNVALLLHLFSKDAMKTTKDAVSLNHSVTCKLRVVKEELGLLKTQLKSGDENVN